MLTSLVSNLPISILGSYLLARCCSLAVLKVCVKSTPTKLRQNMNLDESPCGENSMVQCLAFEYVYLRLTVFPIRRLFPSRACVIIPLLWSWPFGHFEALRKISSYSHRLVGFSSKMKEIAIMYISNKTRLFFFISLRYELLNNLFSQSSKTSFYRNLSIWERCYSNVRSHANRLWSENFREKNILRILPCRF